MPTSSGEALAWLKLPARREFLGRFRDFVMEAADSLALPVEVQGKIDLVLEEVLLNVMDYAYDPEQAGEVDVGCGRAGDSFRIILRDQGRPFNPLDQNNPDLAAGIDQRKVGGLGVFLTKQMADQLHYRHENGRNILELDFKITATSLA